MILSKNTKLLKSLEMGYDTYGVHFAPSDISGRNVCPNASVGCRAACLYFSGYGAYTKVQNFRIAKTKKFHADKVSFVRELMGEIRLMINRSVKKGLTPVFRLNLTSDVHWETIKVDGKNIIEHFPNVQFYDYTKNLGRMLKFIQKEYPSNYHLTFSRSESNEKECDIVLGCGGNVAAVFQKYLPKTRKGRPVISGDEHDLRFLDKTGRKKGYVVGLLAKGKKGKKDETGFVIKQNGNK